MERRTMERRTLEVVGDRRKLLVQAVCVWLTGGFLDRSSRRVGQRIVDEFAQSEHTFDVSIDTGHHPTLTGEARRDGGLAVAHQYKGTAGQAARDRFYEDNAGCPIDFEADNDEVCAVLTHLEHGFAKVLWILDLCDPAVS